MATAWPAQIRAPSPVSVGAGGSPPDPRWRDRGPEGAAGKGHLDLQPAWPSRGGPCPSARRSPKDRVPAAGAPGCPASRSRAPARLPPACAACSAPGAPARPLGPGPQPLAHARSSPPPPTSCSAPQGRARDPRGRQIAGPCPQRLPRGRWRRARRLLPRGLQREERRAAAGPRAGQRGRRRRGPAPTLRAGPGELRPWARPGHRPGLGPGPQPAPGQNPYLPAPSVPTADACARGRVRARVGAACARTRDRGGVGLTCTRCVRARGHACQPPTGASFGWKRARLKPALGGVGASGSLSRGPGPPALMEDARDPGPPTGSRGWETTAHPQEMMWRAVPDQDLARFD